MRHDPKIKRLIRKYGAEGYGLYTYIIECIASNLDSKSPLPDLEESADDLAYDLKMESKLVEEIVSFCIGQELFTVDKITNRVVCEKIYKFLDDASRKNPQILKMISDFNMLRLSPTKSDLLGEIPKGSVNVLPEEEEEEEEEKKKRIEEEKNKLAQFEKFWELYNHKKDRKKCLAKWVKLKGGEIETIFKSLPSYIKNTVTSDKQNKSGVFVPMRKNPITYLNNESWNDEISVDHKEPEELGTAYKEYGT